jgi:16S rRNA (uracil1498-N3)-methyltransferase
MRIPRIFIHEPLGLSGIVVLNEASSHYLGKVLRLSPGRALIVFNGDGHEYSAVIHAVNKHHVSIEILAAEFVNRESPLKTHLAIGISKGDRMDWVLQKATELGVTHITPIFTERTEVRLDGDRLAKRLEHWQQITLSACEQCQRNVIPEFFPVVDLAKFKSSAELNLVLHHRSDQSIQSFTKPASVCLLIGPEGGLSDAEISCAVNDLGFSPLTLGPRVLRTETAPIVALASVQMLWGDLS